jgi:hypothetical protein
MPEKTTTELQKESWPARRDWLESFFLALSFGLIALHVGALYINLSFLGLAITEGFKTFSNLKEMSAWRILQRVLFNFLPILALFGFYGLSAYGNLFHTHAAGQWALSAFHLLNPVALPIILGVISIGTVIDNFASLLKGLEEKDETGQYGRLAGIVLAAICIALIALTVLESFKLNMLSTTYLTPIGLMMIMQVAIQTLVNFDSLVYKAPETTSVAATTESPKLPQFTDGAFVSNKKLAAASDANKNDVAASIGNVPKRPTQSPTQN